MPEAADLLPPAPEPGERRLGRAERLRALRAELRYTQERNRLAVNELRAGKARARRLGRALAQLRGG